jgi:hypothetical protein
MTILINSSECKLVPGHLCAGLTLLKKAREYALDLGTTVWDFAVDIRTLQNSGLDNNDLRWLAGKLYIEWARETVKPTDKCRKFRQDDLLDFNRQTCFVLTALGTDLCECLLSSPYGANGSNGHVVDKNRRGALPSDGATRPNWDSDRHELRLGDYLVKQYKLKSPNQESILAAFEEEDWPPRVDDPLVPHPESEPKERLRNTIKSLNRKQVHRLIRFMGDGTGEAVRWELTDENNSLLSSIARSSVDNRIR